ncbi:major facilitator superfamily domain-containing protein 6-like [Ciona intestinalis]
MFKCQVNVRMIPVKALNFLFYAGLACYMPYKPIFQKQLGLTTTQNGLVQAVDKIVGIATQPISGFIADKTKSIKRVLIVWFILAAIFIFPMYFVPPVDFPQSQAAYTCCGSSPGRLSCADEAGQRMECKLQRNESSKCENTNATTTTMCQIYKDSNISFPDMPCTTPDPVQHINVTCPLIGEDRGEVYGITFSLMFFLTIMSSLFLAPSPALIDATGLQALGKEKVDNYGLQRLWGAIGYGSIALTVGLVTDAISNNGQIDYLFAFISVSVFLLITAGVCTKLDVVSPGAHNVFRGISALLRQPKIILFLLVVYFLGCSIGLQQTFLFWYVDSLPGSTQTILGLAIVANCVVEIPLYILSGWLASKTSYNFLLSFGLFCYGLRFLGYSLITQAWHVIIIETLHGPAFALPITALCAQATLLSPSGMVATTVGVAEAVYWGLGFTTGALLGGVVYNSKGPIVTFRGMMVVSFVTSLLYGVAVKVEERFAKPPETTAVPDHSSENESPSDEDDQKSRPNKKNIL